MTTTFQRLYAIVSTTLFANGGRQGRSVSRLMRVGLIGCGLCWMLGGGTVSAQADSEVVKGLWKDQVELGLFEFLDEGCSGEIRYISPEGVRHVGTFESSQPDKDGNSTFRAKFTDCETDEEINFYFVIFADGISGRVHHRCAKTPIVKILES